MSQQRPQWEDCKVCGGDHWTKDHHPVPSNFANFTNRERRP